MRLMTRRWRVERVTYIEAPTAADAIFATVGVPHTEVNATLEPERQHEKALIPSIGSYVCYRDGQPWPCTAARVVGIEE